MTDEDAVAQMREARDQGLSGWNIRCNLCGRFGATWLRGERPGWGNLALCPEHQQAFGNEKDRHNRAMAFLRKVNYEQPPRWVEKAVQKKP